MTSKSEMTEWADQIVALLERTRRNRPPSKEMLRDMADTISSGDLDCIQLDILCDMIDRRIAKWEPAS